MDEHSLIQQAQDGSSEAFRLLFEENKKRILALAYQFTRNVQDAEDILQDSFIKAYRSLPFFRLQEGTNFSSWLYRIALHVAIDFSRKRKRRREAMRCHRAQKKIVLCHYGELDARGRRELERHLEKCSSCRQNFSEIASLLNLLREARRETEVEKALQGGWEKSWNVIEKATLKCKLRPFSPGRKARPLTFPRWTYAAALVLVFILGIAVGRLWFLKSSHQPAAPLFFDKTMAISLEEHLEDLKPLLLSLANFIPEKKETITLNRNYARSLLIQNFLLKRLLAEKNPSIAELLEDLEIILKEISNLKVADKTTPSLLKNFICERGILLQIGILQKS